MSDPTTVFVYGTLMPGERNAEVARRGGMFTAQPATLDGHQLWHLHPERYPALIAGSPDSTVSGYILTYSPQDWPRARPFLDELEGLHEQPPLYTRQQVAVRLKTGETRPAWVYLYAQPERLTQPGARPVAGGDWRTVTER